MNVGTFEFDFDCRVGESVQVLDKGSTFDEKDVGLSPAEPRAVIPRVERVLRFAENNVEDPALVLRLERWVGGARLVERFGEGVVERDERAAVLGLRNDGVNLDGEGAVLRDELAEIVQRRLLLKRRDKVSRVEQSDPNRVNVVEIEMPGPLRRRSRRVRSP